MMSQLTISFVGTAEIKALLERWAKQDDRSVSSVLRQILQEEIKRREQQADKEKSR